MSLVGSALCRDHHHSALCRDQHGSALCSRSRPISFFGPNFYVGIIYLGRGLVGRGAWTREPGKYPWERKTYSVHVFCEKKTLWQNIV